jgi:hypothetical protein
MQYNNFGLTTIFSLRRLLFAAGIFSAIIFSGCAQGGGPAKESAGASNPPMYHYNPGTRGFETRWPFGPANYH